MKIKCIYLIFGLALLLTACSSEGNNIFLPAIMNPGGGQPATPTAPAYSEPDAPVSDQPGQAGAPVTHSPLDPLENEDKMVRGEVFLDEINLLQMESYPLQIALAMKGTLPTPCHVLRAKVAPPDTENRILVEVFSLSDPAAVCIQMLEPFESRIELGSYPNGSYQVFVNGEMIGNFTQ
jgi:hypothetical protein